MATGAGQRNARVRFERRRDQSDGMGNTKADWIPLCGPVWARLMPLKGSETVLQQRLAGRAPYQVTALCTRATRQVTTADRIVLVRAPGLESGLTFDIQDASPDERGMEISFLVQTGAADG